MSEELMVFDRPNEIQVFRLLAVRAAIRLEQKGLRHSSGRCVKAEWAKHYGLPPRSKADVVIARIEQEMRTLGWTPRPVGAEQSQTGGSQTPGEGG